MLGYYSDYSSDNRGFYIFVIIACVLTVAGIITLLWDDTGSDDTGDDDK